jgi:hypothetical protein
LRVKNQFRVVLFSRVNCIFQAIRKGDGDLHAVQYFVSVFFHRWFRLVWRALFAGNESNLEHGGKIANKNLQ